MDVRIKFGRYDGQVRDIEPVAARAMLKDGRAELPCLDAAPVAEVQTRATLEDWAALAKAAGHDLPKVKRSKR